MKFSLVATFTGVLPEYHCNPYETTLADVFAALKEAGIPDSEIDISEPGDSEYQYLAEENGDIPEKVFAALESVRYGGNEESIGKVVEWILSEFRSSGWFAVMSDVTVSAILTRQQFDAFVGRLGCFAEDCLTLGTLGGPLGGHVMDIPFRNESQELIESIRVTPIPCDSAGEPMEGDDRTWDRVREAILSVYGP